MRKHLKHQPEGRACIGGISSCLCAILFLSLFNIRWPTSAGCRFEDYSCSHNRFFPIISSIIVIPFNKPFLVGKELFYMAQAVMGGHLSGNGPFTRKSQEWLNQRLGVKKSLLTHSCTAALEMAALLCDLKPGDEVIMPSFTFVSTANAFALFGAVPVFVDIRPDTLNMNERLIEAAITDRTKVIVPVHYAGVPCEMDTIMDIARRHRLRVVEDAAQAMLSKYGGKCLGSIGDIGCLSFHETKNIISGEGGALLINDPDLVERAEILWEKGTNRSQFFRGEVDKYTWVDIGSSYLPSELMGAFLWAQLEEADRIIERRRRLFRGYMVGLAPLVESGELSVPFVSQGVSENGHLFYVLLKSGEERDSLMKYLRENGIYAVFHYVPLHSSPCGMRFGRSGSSMRWTDDLSARLLRLPLYYDMSQDDQESVISRVMAFFSVKSHSGVEVNS